MSARKLVAALVLIALLAFVLPTVLAMQVNAGRVARAKSELPRVLSEAGRVLSESAGVRGGAVDDRGAAAHAIGIGVMAGTGLSPKVADGVAWPDIKGGTLNVGPDPWGNQYLVVFGADGSGTATALSAGPNGIVETAFRDLTKPGGDDIVVRK